MRFHLLLVLVLAAAPAPTWGKPSCGTGGPTGEGSGSAGAGTFRYRVPAGYSTQQAIPLLLALHGDEGKPDYIYSTFKGLQSTSGGAFILVAPKAPFGGGSWYQSTANHADFMNAVIAKLLQQYNVDQDRIWITGWSGGATFLGYYAIKRQDILAAVVFHMGGGGAGTATPPPGSCKIPGRFVIGSNDFLYNLAQKTHNAMQAGGHAVKWIELPGVGHDFDKSTLPGTWSWLQANTLCGKTTPGSCGPGSPPDAGTPPPVSDTGVPPMPHADGALPPPPPPPGSDAGPPEGPTDDSGLLQLQRGQPGDLLGGCAVNTGSRAAPLPGSLLPLLAVLWALRRRNRRREN